jgi:hypothetical protein
LDQTLLLHQSITTNRIYNANNRNLTVIFYYLSFVILNGSWAIFILYINSVQRIGYDPYLGAIDIQSYQADLIMMLLPLCMPTIMTATSTYFARREWRWLWMGSAVRDILQLPDEEVTPIIHYLWPDYSQPLHEVKSLRPINLLDFEGFSVNSKASNLIMKCLMCYFSAIPIFLPTYDIPQALIPLKTIFMYLAIVYIFTLIFFQFIPIFLIRECAFIDNDGIRFGQRWQKPIFIRWTEIRTLYLYNLPGYTGNTPPLWINSQRRVAMCERWLLSTTQGFFCWNNTNSLLPRRAFSGVQLARIISNRMGSPVRSMNELISDLTRIGNQNKPGKRQIHPNKRVDMAMERALANREEPKPSIIHSIIIAIVSIATGIALLMITWPR